MGRVATVNVERLSPASSGRLWSWPVAVIRSPHFSKIVEIALLNL